MTCMKSYARLLQSPGSDCAALLLIFFPMAERGTQANSFRIGDASPPLTYQFTIDRLPVNR
jgi:hypothetical protein